MYWQEVQRLQVDWEQWRDAERALSRRRQFWRERAASYSQHLIEGVFNIFALLPWHGNICGFGDLEPLYTLAAYMTQEWFSSKHKDQMLHLL